jgi:hypothetical protein
MFGRFNGATVFLRSYMPYAISLHGMAHREALAAKDVNDPLIRSGHECEAHG